MNKATSKPAVTIVTPLYNSSAFVRDTLDSVLKQTFSNWEIILVDDGSTDDIAQVIHPYLADRRFKYIRQENQGIAAARNTGIKAASGDWICLLDHDDRWLPSKLEKQVRYALLNDCQIVGTDAFIVEGTSHWVYSELFMEVAARLERSVCDSGIDVFGILIKQNPFCTCSVIISKSLFDEYGLLDLDATPADDYEMWLRCMPDTRIGFINEPLVEYFKHEDNYSNNEVRMLEKIIYALQKNSRVHVNDETRSRQFNESITWEYEVLLRKLVETKAYSLMLRHGLSIIGRGRSGVRLLYRVLAAPTVMRLKNSIRHRLRGISYM